MQANRAIDFPITGYYDQQRFKQFNPSDCANWYLVQSALGKKQLAMYPQMGRRHINTSGINRLQFAVEPRGLFKSINYVYVVIGSDIFRVDQFYNTINISQSIVTTISGDIFFDYLVTPSETYACFVDGQHIYVYRETFGDFQIQSGVGVPTKPKFIAAFGNRLVVSQLDSSQFNLSEINLAGGTAGTYDPTKSFNVVGAAVFNQESGIIRQFAVLNNTLYIFTDFTTGIWSNIPSVFVNIVTATTSTFPWRKNTSTAWDVGMSDPKSLDVGFNMIVWQGRNSEGLVQIFVSSGQAPKPLSTKAIDILFQNNIRQNIIGGMSPFLNGKADGFLYQWENTIFYRLSAGEFHNYGILDVESDANSIEFNFDTKSWARCIEKNGERNRVQKHVFFSPNNVHLVSLKDDGTIYQMSGQFYDNETTNPVSTDPQSAVAYIREPFRYERTTPIIAEDDYGEFLTEWVQIDFVFGENFNLFSDSPFANAQFIIDEALGIDNQPVYLIAESDINGNPIYLLDEAGNTPAIDELTYNNIFKPHIELYWSDDGGISFNPADVLEFSQLGVYQWRMRWYQLGPSRNRCYKLVCVSPSPIVVLGGVMMTRRISGGAA
jgi:hypothetical protein